MRNLVRGLVLMVVLGGLAFLAASATLQWREPPPEPPPQATTAEVVANPTERVRVEVLNAGGVSGMARAATQVLRDSGFDVVEVGNASSFDREASVVLARLGRMDMAGMVADVLGIPIYQNEPDSAVFVDVTVLLGKDWNPPPIKRPGIPPAQAMADSDSASTQEGHSALRALSERLLQSGERLIRRMGGSDP